MSIQISYKSSSPKKSSNNLILFVDEKFNINPVKKDISPSPKEKLFLFQLKKI